MTSALTPVIASAIEQPIHRSVCNPFGGRRKPLSIRFADILKGRTAIAYDPQDLTTMYQDAQGTLPVYQPGSGQVDPPVGLLLDKSLGMELGPELVPNPGPGFDSTTGFLGGVPLSVVGGRLRVTAPVGVDPNTHLQVFPVLPAAGRYLIRIGLRLGSCPALIGQAWGGGLVPLGGVTTDTDYESRQLATAGTAVIRIYFHTAVVPGDYFELTHVSIREIKGYHAYQTTVPARPTLSGRYNQLDATETLSTQSVTTAATGYTLRFEGTGTVTLSGTATGTYSAGTHTVTCTVGTLTLTVSGSVTKADLRVKRDGSSLPPYQRVDSANTYDTNGFPLYLWRDKVDDDLIVQAPAITGVIGRGTPDGAVVGNGIIAEGEYHPLAETITTGLPEITKIVAVDGALTASEQAVIERYLAMTSLGQPVISPAAEAVFSFGLTSVSSFTFVLQAKDNYSPVLVDWGDGHMSAHVGIADQTAAHTYAVSGTYAVKVYAEDQSVLTKFRTTDAGMSGTLRLPSGMTHFRCEGSNTLSGTLSLPSGMTFFRCTGSNTLSGTLSLPSEMTTFSRTGSNTLSGTLSLPSGVTTFICVGSNTLSGYTPSEKASNQERFYLTGLNTMSATDVDNILIDYAAAGGTWGGAKEITIQGNAANRTSASDAAYASLAAKLTTLDVD